MTWRKNPRTITKEQFSTGTTIDGDRIDNALDDVVERVNDIPYGDLRKRWVPTTYVAGWTPQSPGCITSGTPTPTGGAGSDSSQRGSVYGTHHWPWLRVLNYVNEVADGTEGSGLTDDTKASNRYRLKGVSVPGVSPFGKAGISSSTYTPVDGTPIGAQYAWTRSWFFIEPSILDAIDLILEVDHASYTGKIFNNSFSFDATKAPNGYTDLSARDLVITASVDSEFAREDRNMADVEVLRKGFTINADSFSRLSLPKDPGTSPGYSDMTPSVSNTGGSKAPASTVQGIHLRLRDLNIPIHQNARLRVAVVIPSYSSDNRNNGWNPNNNSVEYPWMQQKIHMAVTMLEEVTSG